jgi:hypothetical protein
MEIDSSFNWQLTDQIESGGPGKNILIRDHDDYDITQRNTILKLVNAPTTSVEEDLGFDPYNTGFIEK